MIDPNGILTLARLDGLDFNLENLKNVVDAR